MHVTARVELGELVLRSSEVEHLEIRQELGHHTTCAVHFTRDSDSDVQLDALLGARARVVFSDENLEAVAFEGIVSSGRQSHQLNYGSLFHMDAISESVRLDYVNTAYYPESTVAEIARRLGADVVGSPRARGPLDFVQNAETDFEFLVRIADEAGCFVRTTGQRPELHCAFVEAGHELHWGDDLLAISATCDPANHGFKGAAYQVSDKQDHRFHGIRKNPTWLGGAPKLVAAARTLAARVEGGGDVGVIDTQDRAPLLADFRASLERESERALGTAVFVEGSSVEVRLTAGDGVVVLGGTNFTLPTIGKLGLVRVIHRFDAHQYSNEFTATPWANYTARRRPARRLVSGPMTAEVIENEDPEKMGRIRVRYRWQETSERTSWVRLVTPHTGNERGMLFIPEVGDEVLVAFEQGDPERPFVLGSVWNGKDHAPQANGAKKIVTKSGNTIRMIDDGGKETVEVFSAKGTCLIQLSNDAGGKPLLTIHSEGDIAIEAVGDLRISCANLYEKVGQNVHVKAGNSQIIEASKDVIVKAGANLALMGTNTATKASANMEAVAGAMHSIVGSLVHIQPPGFVSRPVTVPPLAETSSVWGEQPVPATSAGRSTSDPKTPRATG